MQTRKLGFTDLHLSEIGFGAWALGGDGWAFGWGPQDDSESIAAIRRSLELGVNWIDTAAIYGHGHSETVVAKAVEGIRDEVIIATKCSIVWDENGKTSCCLKADSILKECEDSLRRLKTDRIDLYQIHWPNDPDNIEEGWEAMGQLIKDGKIRYGGVSNYRVSHLEQCQPKHPIASLQPPYSMLRRAVELEGEFEYCKNNDIGIVPYSPMQCGLLTDSFDMNRVAENDWRRQSDEFKSPNLEINQNFAKSLKEIANKYEKTVAQLAVAWTLRLDVVTSSIVGARRPSQIEETVGASGWEIEKEDLDEIDEMLGQRVNEIKKQDGYLV